MDTNWDAAVVVILILVVAAVAFGVLFRHRIKLALKGPGGAEFSVEGENRAVEREERKDGSAPAARVAATGERSVAVGRDANRSTTVTGDRNRVG